ncbi:hypothetical protein SCLCIDRAFT_499340 [Scleroderma citrinum Foug A]|uniref:Uncharacterized protein n=1 Tax=Scleroderma citrinum Foug A TaxID=1036808 RepID=A0A0C3EBC0_9AGAM|nr:hypothetical protein SCLCIDRAFT_499340 [Scleroderma citrinum Foug A]
MFCKRPVDQILCYRDDRKIAQSWTNAHTASYTLITRMFLLIECSIHFILGVASHRRALLTDLHPPVLWRSNSDPIPILRAKIHPLWSLLGLSVYFKPTADIIARKEQDGGVQAVVVIHNPLKEVCSPPVRHRSIGTTSQTRRYYARWSVVSLYPFFRYCTAKGQKYELQVR